MGVVKFCFLVLLLAGAVLADIYLHNPRGSNDRRSENTPDRTNANRLFNSENNARGGYSWGPSMTYYEDSVLPIQWTAQHGCGSDQVECNFVIQYMCVDAVNDPKEVQIRDGTTTDTIPDNANNFNKQDNTGEYTYGMHESYQYYQTCKARERNQGLFTADLVLNGKSAIYTRQTADGTQYGFQCNEERDYYPYWHPSPWKDIAVMSPNQQLCGLYKKESQNVKDKNYCSIKVTGTNLVPNNEAACTTAGGTWTSEPSHNIAAPECQLAAYSRDNHLGNGVEGVTANYEWRVPQGESCAEKGKCNCVVRLRYNVSTANTNNWGFDDASDNGKASPVQTNPVTQLENDDLQMALNTNQYGRVFEDRSFTFHIAKRPKDISASTPIYNLNVRGKRGNIVQTYPATEYDYVPNDLRIKEGDYVHFQWTGADTNPNGNAGEGIAGTDRTNIVQITSLNDNMPLTTAQIEASGSSMFDNGDLRHFMGFTGQKNCPTIADLLKKNGNNQNAVNNDPTNCAKLNAAPAYFNAGPVRMNKTGTFYYMSSRNNNFSNRTQKGKMTVDPKLSTTAVVGIAIACLIGLLAATLIGGFIYSKKNPHSALAMNVYNKLPSVLSTSPTSPRPSALDGERTKPLLG